MKMIWICLILLITLQISTFAQLHSEFRKMQITFGSFIDDNPSFSPDGKAIAFNSNRAGGKQLFSMQLTDSTPKQITFDSIAKQFPVWHPKTNGLIAVQNRKDVFLPFESGKAFIIQPILKRKVQFFNPAFNPLGNLLAFTGKSENDRYWKLMTYDFRYDNLNVLETKAGNVFHPRWSPNGAYISYHQAKNDFETEINIVRWDGSLLHTISKDTLQLSEACWGSSNRKLACIGKNHLGYWLIIISVDGKITESIAFSAHRISSPGWSKDGSKIVVSVGDSNQNQHLWLLFLDQF